jgi:hypothetical protein
VASHHHTAATMPSDTKKSASGVRKPIVLLPKSVNIFAYLTVRESPVDPPSGIATRAIAPGHGSGNIRPASNKKHQD